jgi:ferrochelatase
LNSKQNTTKYKAFVAMRCWHPRASETMQEVKKYNPNEIILLPLYPQYSAATSGSSLSEWKELANNNNLNIKTKTICCYPEDKNFIKAHSKLIMEKIKNLKNFKLIFSAHGLPEKNIKKGDPYQWQIEQSVKRIMDEINDSNIDYILSYQSRVGPLKWIGPSTDEVIVKNSKLNKCLVVVPIAFVSEHSETLVELDIEYEKLARTNSCAEYIRIETLGVNENFIDGLTDLILNNENYKLTDTLYPPKNRCPSNFTKCPCLN